MRNCNVCDGQGWLVDVESDCCLMPLPNGDCCGCPAEMQVQIECDWCEGKGVIEHQPYYEGNDMSNRTGVHASHCCVKHGCKYGDDDCPVVSGAVEQLYDCEDCDWDYEEAQERWTPWDEEKPPSGKYVLVDFGYTMAVCCLDSYGDLCESENINVDYDMANILVEGTPVAWMELPIGYKAKRRRGH